MDYNTTNPRARVRWSLNPCHFSLCLLLLALLLCPHHAFQEEPLSFSSLFPFFFSRRFVSSTASYRSYIGTGQQKKVLPLLFSCFFLLRESRRLILSTTGKRHNRLHIILLDGPLVVVPRSGLTHSSPYSNDTRSLTFESARPTSPTHDTSESHRQLLSISTLCRS